MWGLEIFNSFPKAQNHYNQDSYSMEIFKTKYALKYYTLN